MSVVHVQSISGITSISTPVSSDVLTLHTNNDVERLRIDSSGKIGIGVAAPATKVHIHGGDETLLITGDTAVGSAANTCLLYTSPSPRDRG